MSSCGISSMKRLGGMNCHWPIFLRFTQWVKVRFFLARVMPTYIRRRSSSKLPSSTLSPCGNTPSSQPIKNTYGNSKPLEACSVIMFTASTSSCSLPSSKVIKAMVWAISKMFLPSFSPLLPIQRCKSITLRHLISPDLPSSCKSKWASNLMVSSKACKNSPAGLQAASVCQAATLSMNACKSCLALVAKVDNAPVSCAA